MHYILSLILIISFSFAKSNEYSVTIDEEFNNVLLDVTQNYDRSISAVGFTKKYINSSLPSDIAYTNPFDYLENISSSYGSQIHLVKLDDKANILLRKSANLSDFNEAVSILKTPQDGYFIGGYTLDGSSILAKLSPNGDFLFKKEFGTKNKDVMNKLIPLSDGGVLAVGSSVTTRSGSDNVFETGLGLNDIYLARFTKDGDKLWSKKYGTDYDDKGIDAVEANDGSIVLLSQTNYENNNNLTLMRINQNGNKIWLKHYKSKKKSTPYKILKLRNNNFIVSMSQLDDMNKKQIRLIKFDLQKNILADKEIFTTYSSVIKDIKEYSNSNLIAVGYAKDSSNTDGLAMLFDSDLGLLQQEHFGKENYDAFNAVTVLHNSQAAVVGINTDENSQESNMWILKLNRDLSISQISTKSSDVYKNLNLLFKKELDSGLIEIKEDLSINLIDKGLYFKVSEYVINKKQKEFLKPFSIKLFKFLKANQSVVDTLEINGHTSSEWSGVDFTDSYLKNEKLSMKRSYSALELMYKSQDMDTKKYLSKILKGSGLGYSKKVLFNEYEDKKKSRRVSFKIILSQK